MLVGLFFAWIYVKYNLSQLMNLSKTAEARGDRTDLTTEALEASPPCLICTQSQIQYSQPFFSPSSDSVRALSLMGRRDADGWMTVG